MPFILAYRGSLLSKRRRSISDHHRTPTRSPTRSVELLKWSEIPVWYQDNHCILSSYRPLFNSVPLCFRSIFAIHNETLNIWTHLIPCILFLLSQLTVKTLFDHHYPNSTPLDRFVFTTNLFAAITCLLLSSLYHTLMCHSQPISSLWLRIDYVGILTLILGSFFSGISVGFHDRPIERNIYWSMIVTLSLITSILVLHPRLQGLKYRSLRTWSFILTSMSGFAPIIHGLVLHGWEAMWVRRGMPYWFMEGAVYGVGVFFFVTRIPESIKPGKFDVWGGSHSIFHALVVVASVVHLWGVWRALGSIYADEVGGVGLAV